MGRTAKRGESLLTDPEVIFQAAKLFLEGLSAGQIARQINRACSVSADQGLSREQIYPLIRKAYSRRLLELHPPVSQDLRDRLAERFGIMSSSGNNTGKKDITVVYASVTDADSNVALEAARNALDKAIEIRNTRRAASNHEHRGQQPAARVDYFARLDTATPATQGLKRRQRSEAEIVTLGLGPGQATLDFVRCFGRLLMARADPPSFRLVSVTAGCLATKPHLAATSMFNLLPQELVAEQYGMFSGNLVTAKAFPHVKALPGVRESFAIKNRVDILVTSMGDFADPHDLLRQHLVSAGVKMEELCAGNNERYVGNVQYRPYTNRRFVKNEALRAVTLFELDELVALANSPQKSVILIARKRTYDGRTRSEALLPLLKNPEMQLFSQLVIDEATAREILCTDC